MFMLEKTKGLTENDLPSETNYLAYERTMLAWIRTAVSLITFGFTLYKFFEDRKATEHDESILGPRIIGLTMIGLGMVSLMLATFEYRGRILTLKGKNKSTPVSYSYILALLMGLLGVMTFLGALFRK